LVPVVVSLYLSEARVGDSQRNAALLFTGKAIVEYQSFFSDWRAGRNGLLSCLSMDV
jgi:hypothetical protein